MQFCRSTRRCRTDKLPSNVTRIGSYSFNKTAISKLVLINDNKTLCYIPASYTNYAIPDTVNTTNEGAFTDCQNLASAIIPGSVTSIENYAFSGCKRLTAITIPGSVTSIGDYAFDGCKSLTAVTIQKGVTHIGAYAFNNCINLTAITIPDSVVSFELKGSCISGVLCSPICYK